MEICFSSSRLHLGSILSVNWDIIIVLFLGIQSLYHNLELVHINTCPGQLMPY